MYNTALIYKNFGEPLSVLQRVTTQPGALTEGYLRVEMLLAPVNASDLIPITGAYRHRIALPAVAGYEGMGRVIEATPSFSHLIGQRVLPLRSSGTWQRIVDCLASLAIPVPDDIDDALAARAWINPHAAQLMLKHYPCAGKEVIVTAAGTACAMHLGQWAWLQGAKNVTGVYRSAIHAQRLVALGITPVSEKDTDTLRACANRGCIVYDAVGGVLADTLLDAMPDNAQFVSYGLLSGQPFAISRKTPTIHWFHIRNYLAGLSDTDWQQTFSELCPTLRKSYVSDTTYFPLHAWRKALDFYYSAGRTSKPMLTFSQCWRV
ncbi:zinc-dependent alcohol dehydrogenase family protein [Vagococcus sp. WN89Y]|uniref:zinc-dependent alcohol dehydrogenase family protein n=1 Tax=Vagococcus sp. WN89Y TaxID=3457258 RepID=UPI003FCCC47C